MSGDRSTFTEERLSAAVSAIRSYDAVVVLGAGASAFGYPMTAQLPALLWQAIGGVGRGCGRRAASPHGPDRIAKGHCGNRP